MVSEILQQLTVQSSKLYDTPEIKSILRLFGSRHNYRGCSGLTLSGTFRPRLVRRGLALSNG